MLAAAALALLLSNAAAQTPQCPGFVARGPIGTVAAVQSLDAGSVNCDEATTVVKEFMTAASRSGSAPPGWSCTAEPVALSQCSGAGASPKTMTWVYWLRVSHKISRLT